MCYARSVSNRSPLVVWLSTFMLACSSDPDSSTSSSGSVSGSQDTTGENTGDSGEPSTETGASETTASPDCLQDESPEGPTVTFTLRNLSDDAIFVVSPLACEEGYVRIDLVGSTTGRWPIDVCAPTCSAIVSGDCWDDCACSPPRLLRIEPGASHDVVWDGQLWVGAELPSECNACGVAPDCLLGISAPPETYLVTVTASTMATDCVDEGGQPSCSCPDAAQTCLLAGQAINPTELPIQAHLEYPDANTLELTFE
jgi:hypothetical protein